MTANEITDLVILSGTNLNKVLPQQSGKALNFEAGGFKPFGHNKGTPSKIIGIMSNGKVLIYFTLYTAYEKFHLLSDSNKAQLRLLNNPITKMDYDYGHSTCIVVVLRMG